MNHFRPHLYPPPPFEGYYTKFTLPSATIILIICSVPSAKTRPHMVSLTYIPNDYPRTPRFQKELWVEGVEMVEYGVSSKTEREREVKKVVGGEGEGEEKDKEKDKEKEKEVVFELVMVPAVVGYMRVYSDESVEYLIRDHHHQEGSFEFRARVQGGRGSRVPWVRDEPESTPEGGILVKLPLPLHWHVHSLASKAEVEFVVDPQTYRHGDVHVSVGGRQGTKTKTIPAHAHLEKNWARSFPTSHVWVQAVNTGTDTGTTPVSALSVAGGAILASQAYLLTYHSSNPRYSTTFAPPYALAPPLIPSLTLVAKTDWHSRSIHLEMSSLTTKIVVDVHAPHDSFVAFSAPFGDGHRPDALAQSMVGVVDVRVFWRGWSGGWREVWRERFEKAAIEFGGEAYGGGGG